MSWQQWLTGIDLARVALCCQTRTNLTFIFGVLQSEASIWLVRGIYALKRIIHTPRPTPFLVVRCLPAIDALLFQGREYVAARLLMDFLSLIHHASLLGIA